MDLQPCRQAPSLLFCRTLVTLSFSCVFQKHSHTLKWRIHGYFSSHISSWTSLTVPTCEPRRPMEFLLLLVLEKMCVDLLCFRLVSFFQALWRKINGAPFHGTLALKATFGSTYHHSLQILPVDPGRKKMNKKKKKRDCVSVCTTTPWRLRWFELGVCSFYVRRLDRNLCDVLVCYFWGADHEKMKMERALT